jgi:sec-independent protein translocase protein TatC
MDQQVTESHVQATPNTQSIWEHVIDLRNTAIKILVSWLVFTALTIPYSQKIFSFLTKPIGEESLNFFGVADPFLFNIKMHLMLGFFLAFPFVLWFVWRYIMDIFSVKSRKIISTIVPISLVLAYVGLVYGYVFLIPSSVEIMFSFKPVGTQILLSASDYISFVLGMLMIVIVIFQVPLVIFSLIRTRIVKAEFFKKHRKEIYFGFLVVTAALTPTPDIFTMFMVLIPILLMYEIALVLGSLGLSKDLK